LLSLSVTDIHPPDEIPVVLQRIQARAEGRFQGHATAKLLRKDGGLLWADIASNRITYDGRPRMAGFFRDVTERMQAEAALAESEAKYRQLIETTATGYLILDDEGRVVDANAEYVRISGHHDLSEIVGHSVMEWTAPYDRRRNAREVELCVHSGRVRQLDVDYIGLDGSITPIEINANVIATKDGKRIVSLCRDISERRKAQEALERERRTLEHRLQSSDHERQMIAYEIHDRLAQELAGAIMQFDAFGRLRDTKPKQAADAYNAALTMLRQGHLEARRLSSGVRPPILDEAAPGTKVVVELPIVLRRPEDEQPEESVE